MASICKEILIQAPPAEVWSAVRDVGAIHTRLAPGGWVVDTTVEPGARVVTFKNGTVVREPIVSLDDGMRRLVWTAESRLTSHYNGALQVFDGENQGTRLVWIADFLPDTAAPVIQAAIEAALAATKAAQEAAALDKAELLSAG